MIATALPAAADPAAPIVPPTRVASVVDPRLDTIDRSAPTPDPPLPPLDPVAGAPRPGDESGRIDGGDHGDGLLRLVVRGVLFVPKVAVEFTLSPVRGTVWANERFQLKDLYNRVFFNKDLTIGLYPIASFDSEYGVNGGARLVDRDLFGAHERFSLQASAGGQYRANAAAGASTGTRLGTHVGLAIAAELDRRGQDPFYGIGNGDLATAPPVPMPIDPLVDTTAIETRYREQVARVAVEADVRPFDRFHLIATGALTDLRFGRSDTGPPIDSIYDRSRVVGFDGVRHAYPELEVRWDGRHPAKWDAVYAYGGLVAAYAGRVHRLDSGVDFTRAGFELQYFLRLGVGPRVLATRFHADAVSGTRDEVPMSELPKLGGGSFLRGYPADRFRDRVAAVGSAEYQWDLSRMVDASVFVDAGRVFASVDELAIDHMRVGYGVSLALHGADTGAFLLSGSIASSIDGGVFLNLAFNPVFDARGKWR